MTPSKIFDTHSVIHVKSMVSKELCEYLTHMLMLYGSRCDVAKNDLQVVNFLSALSHDYAFQTLQEIIWPSIEVAVGEEILPTYSYARLYQNGNVLLKHKDKPACEVSVTIQLGRSHHYSWPIYMGGQRFDLAEGDGVIYSACDIEHWRDTCNGPDGYYSGQVFLHFVRKNGRFSSEAGDLLNRPGVKEIVYTQNRTALMVNK